ncbi:MAG TPA: UDP-glucuronic acid decarboxylase family protein [Myxococcaceae bacterium]|nr:UDP-glucuronic acid decarboxylase family protein [Myxococcaceae bacterium]
MKTFQGVRAAVLGGAGFLGSHLCERLLRDGASKVIAIDNLVTGLGRNVEELSALRGFSFVQHDICEPIHWEGRCDVVFNFASPASPIDYAQLPIETLRTGALGTENALRLAERTGAVFLQASTSEVYGDPQVHPQHEDYWGNVNPVGPRSCYDEAKRYGEAMVAAFRRARGVDTRIVRIFNTYGPRMRLDDGRVVPAFISQALRGEDFTVFGDGTQTRSFCYVSDLIEGICRLALSNEVEPVNMGNPTEMSVLEFAEAVRRVAGGGGRIAFRPMPQDDPKQRQPDITRARERLGWEPKVPLDEGLRETIAYFRAVVGTRSGS